MKHYIKIGLAILIVLFMLPSVIGDATIDTESALNVGPSNTTLQLELKDMHAAGSVYVRFKYGLTTDYGYKTPNYIMTSTGFYNQTLNTVVLFPSTTYQPSLVDIIIPDHPKQNKEFNISIVFADNENITTVIFHYRTNGDSWINMTMIQDFGQTYSITIGPFVKDTEIEFFFTAKGETPFIWEYQFDSDGIYYSLSIGENQNKESGLFVDYQSFYPVVALVLLSILFKKRNREYS